MDIGLDVGVTACRAAAILGYNKNATVFLTTDGDRTEPSCTYFAPNQRSFGRTAQIKAKYGDNKKFFTQIRRRLLDSDGTFEDALHYAMLVENAFRIFTGDRTVNSVMLTVPVMANCSQRQTLEYIATTAVGVHEDQVGIINDTTAAVVAYAVENLAPGQVKRDVLMFSLGGGIRESVLRKHVGAKIKEFVLQAEAIRVKHSLTSARGADVDIQIEEVEPDVDCQGVVYKN